MGRKCGVDRGLFQRGGAWWIRWTRPSRHDDQKKIGPTKFSAKAFYQKRKLVVKEEAHLRAAVELLIEGGCHLEATLVDS